VEKQAPSSSLEDLMETHRLKPVPLKPTQSEN